LLVLLVRRKVFYDGAFWRSSFRGKGRSDAQEGGRHAAPVNDDPMPMYGEGLRDDPHFSPGPECPTGWWLHSIRKRVDSARQLSTFHSHLDKENLTPWAGPFAGYCLMASTTFHIVCSPRKWESCEEHMGDPAKIMLIADLCHLIQLRES
jgi:hypothetical protein